MKEPTKRLNVEIPFSLHKAVKQRALDDDCDARNVVVNALNEYLETN